MKGTTMNAVEMKGIANVTKSVNDKGNNNMMEETGPQTDHQGWYSADFLQALSCVHIRNAEYIGAGKDMRAEQTDGLQIPENNRMKTRASCLPPMMPLLFS